MRITTNNDSVCISFINMQDFAKLYDEYQSYVKTGTGKSTTDVENEGASLLKDGLDDVQRINEFVRNVFVWGGTTGNRVRGLVYKYQTEEEVAKVVAESARMLQKGDLESAIDEITSIKGLHISFGSKVLRMLSPQQAGVYDSIMAAEFSYPLEADGYVEFCADCKAVADELKKRGIKSNHRENGEWFVADVEAVIFYNV